eukprot:4797420-Amphidinium_carterae.2
MCSVLRENITDVFSAKRKHAMLPGHCIAEFVDVHDDLLIRNLKRGSCNTKCEVIWELKEGLLTVARADLPQHHMMLDAPSNDPIGFSDVAQFGLDARHLVERFTASPCGLCKHLKRLHTVVVADRGSSHEVC